jgi:hypothetical protein
MPAPHDDELPTLDTADLSRVTGGASSDMSSMMLPMMMMMMRSRSQGAMAAAPPPPVPAWKPTITVDGVAQPVTAAADGSYTTTNTI